MHYMIVNLDRKEYIRPLALGAPHGSKYEGLGSCYDPYSWQWLILLAQILERRNSQGGASGQQPRPFSWAGERLLILRGDDDSDFLLPEDLQALVALGAPGITPYKYIRETFKDRTEELKDWWPKEPWMVDSRFGMITRPRDFSWLTPEQLRDCLGYARLHRGAFLQGYVVWLARQRGLRPEVKALLQKVKTALVKDPTLATLDSVFSGGKERPPEAP